MKLRSNCHPEANGRQPQVGDVAWTLKIPLENGDILELEVGQKGRDLLFGMMIADFHDSKEEEPDTARIKQEVKRIFDEAQEQTEREPRRGGLIIPERLQ